MKRSLIHIENCQVKSREKLIALANALDVIEKECAIKQPRISFKNMFVCPDIDLNEFDEGTPMERLVSGLFKNMKNDVSL